MRKAVLIVALALAWPAAGWSDDLEARAEAAWQKRDNLDQALLAVDLYKQLVAKNPGDDKMKIKLARAAYWAIEADDALMKINGSASLNKDKRVELAQTGIDTCRVILARDQHHPEANYWTMWNMAAKTLAKGIFSGFAFRDSVVGTIMVSKNDVGYHYGGVYTYWGAVISQIPGLLGRFFHFTKDDSVWLYQQSMAVEPNYLKTHVWLAEVHEDMGKKDLARKEYEFCASASADALPEVAPENRLYKRLAEKRLKKL